ncbi:MAG: hypothetical protein HKM93_12675 [Desulfobacteraceae bacterium]|nr:hypothetical protein [Desulfobacteraceae bacterium]
MKTSNKLLLAAGVGFFGIFILFPLIVLKTSVATPAEKTDTDSAIQDRTRRSFAVTDFTELYIDGHWEVKIRQGTRFGVVVSGSQYAVNRVDVNRQGETLRLIVGRGSSNLAPESQHKVHALVTLPRLRNLELEGLVRVELKGFHEDYLKFKTDGYTEISGTDNAVTDLSVESDGLFRLAFINNPVNNADLECEGMIDITLTMAGGDITGEIDGFGRLDYDGEVRNNRLKRFVWD